VSKFNQIFEQRQQLLRNEPGRAHAEAHAHSRLVSNFESRVKVRSFEVIVDQPKGMGSGDNAPALANMFWPRWRRVMKSLTDCMQTPCKSP
jgi:hypothetical protein